MQCECLCKLRGMSIFTLECPGEHLILLIVLAEVLDLASSKHIIADLHNGLLGPLALLICLLPSTWQLQVSINLASRAVSNSAKCHSIRHTICFYS